MKKQLMSAMAYPMFLGIFCFCVVIGLLLFVIPSMSELFQGRHLHPLTQGILNVSQFLKKWFFLLCSISFSGILFLFYFFKEHWKKIIPLIQKIPLIKTIATQAALIRFSRSISLLLRGGIPLVNALNISRGAVKHPLIEETLAKAESYVAEGNRLSILFRKSNQIPPLVSRMLAIAEETGKLPEMFQSLSEIYDDQLERSLNHITTFLQPVLLLVMGGIIGLIILSILLPLSDVSSLISSALNQKFLVDFLFQSTC